MSENKKKICHMTSAHNQDDDRIFYKECISLAKAGYDTYLIAKGETSERDGVHIIGMGQPPNCRLSRMMIFTKKVYQKAVELDADIYHLHDPELLPFAMKLKKRGKKVIFDSHEFYALQILEKGYIPSSLRTSIAKLYSLHEKKVFKKIDAVIFPCAYCGENYFSEIANRSVLVANYAIQHEFFDRYDAEALKENYVCYVGGLTYDRGITHTIQAAGKANVRLVLAGNYSPKRYRDEVRKLPEFCVVDERGFVSRDEVVEICGNAFAGMCILLNVGQYNKLDTFGVKVYEYMAMGIPVILSDSDYARRVMKTYKFGILVDSNDVDTIADAISYLRRNPDEARRMGQNGRSAVAQEFNWETQEKVLCELYESLS